MQTFFASKTWFLSEPGHTCLWFCLFGNVLVFPTEDMELKAPAVVAHLPPIWLPATDLRMMPAGSLCWIVTLPVWSIPTQSNFPMSFFPSGLTSPIVLSPRWLHPVDEDRFPFRFNRSLCILPDTSWVVFCFLFLFSSTLGASCVIVFDLVSAGCRLHFWPPVYVCHAFCGRVLGGLWHLIHGVGVRWRRASGGIPPGIEWSGPDALVPDAQPSDLDELIDRAIKLDNYQASWAFHPCILVPQCVVKSPYCASSYLPLPCMPIFLTSSRCREA